MGIPFYKMSGSGNDFIIIDNRENIIVAEGRSILAKKLCTQHLSIGADGFILIEKSDLYDFKWDFYNSDGSKAEMCGNASRCVARFALMEGIAAKKMSFETLAGRIDAEVKDDDKVKVLMTEPFDLRLAYPINLSLGVTNISSINTGVPHTAFAVDDIENFDIQKYGQEIRYHEAYSPKGTNANFYKILGNDKIRVRTYERGVEAETLACGTGSVAVAIIASKLGECGDTSEIITSGGTSLKVYLEGSKVYLEGEARLIYKGTFTNEAYEF